MAYFCTILTEEWRDSLEHDCESYRMLWSAANQSVTLVRAATEAVEGVEVEFSVSTLKCGKLLGPLLQLANCAFSITALCPRNPMACPVALDVYVNTPQWEGELAATGTFVGESALVELLHVGSRSGLLVKREVASPLSCDTGEAPTRKRARVATPVVDTPLPHVVEWMRSAECGGGKARGGNTVALPQFLDVPGSSHVLCLREMAFVPREYGHWSSTSVSGGLLVGPRSTGKTECVVRLLQHAPSQVTRGGQGDVPPFLRAVPTTLLVVPAHLLAQWHAALTSARLATVVVHNKKTWSHACTLLAVSQAAVVLTTHQYFATVIKKPSVKHKSRMFSARPLADVGGTPVRFDWLWWRRVVVDEALSLFTRMQGVCARSSSRHARGGIHSTAVRSRSWWGLQGGVAPTSLPMCALVDMLHMHARGLGPLDKAVHMCDIHAYQSCVLALSPPPSPLLTVREQCIFTTLSPPHRKAYELLRRSGCAPAELLQVCAGDLDPVRQFMTPVRSWLDALPLGLKVLNDYILSQEVEFTWSNANDEEGGDEGDDDNEGEGGEGGESGEGGEGGESGEGGEGGESGESGEGGEGGEGGLEVELDVDAVAGGAAMQRVRDQIESMITRVLNEEGSEVRERRAFFERVTSDLAMGREDAGTCNVCLTNDADCVFVCGHLMCHECVIHLFVTAKNSATEEYSECLDCNLAPCPSCRWNVEPHEVFWVHGGSSTGGEDGSKVDALVRLLKPLVDEGQRVLIVTGGSAKDDGVYVTLSHTVCERLMYHGLPARVLTVAAPSCCQNWTWFMEPRPTGARGQVLVVYSDQLRGMKLPDVRDVVMLHPALDGVSAQQCVKRDVLNCCEPRGQRARVNMHHFIVRDTVEEVVVVT